MLRTSLRYFMAVARLGSIRAASGQLNVAQSAVSRQVQALEHQLGTVLLDRLTNGVVLTQAGRILYEFGRKVEFETDELQSDLGSLQGLLRGHVRIATIESMVPYVLPRALGRFRESHPSITFAVEATASERIANLVLEGSADIGIGLNARVGADFHVVSSTREPLMAVTSASHPLAQQEQVSLQELAQWPMALAPHPSASRVIFEEACRVANIKVAPALETNSVELMQRMATLGLGVALLLRHTIAGSVQNGQLTGLGLDKQLFAGTIDVFTFKDRTLPIAVKQFLSTLLEEIGT